MGQQADPPSEPNGVGRRRQAGELAGSGPKPGDLAAGKPRALAPKGCTRGCCKTLGGPAARGDKPIKPGDSWFSAKRISVRRARARSRGRRPPAKDGPRLLDPAKTAAWGPDRRGRAKVPRPEGDSPDRRLRRQIAREWGRWGAGCRGGVGLKAAVPQR